MNISFKKTIVSFLVVLSCAVSFVLPLTAQAATADELRSKVVSVASAEIGYYSSNNVTKYGAWYGYQGAWCTTFSIWCVDQADRAMGTSMYKNIVPSGGDCNSMINWFNSRGRYAYRSSGYVPKAGDFIFFDWGGDGRSDHVGIVSSSNGSKVFTVEGNVSSSVGSRSYSIGDGRIMGYGMPNYEQYGGAPAATTQPQPPAATTPDTEMAPKTGYVSTEKLNVRQAPNGKVLTIINEGAAVTVSATNGDWYKITVGSTTGYVSKQYITFDAPAAATTKAPETTTKAPEAPADPSVPTGMRIYADTDELKVGESIVLHNTLKPEGATGTVTYKSDHTNIVTVDQNGNVTAVGAGDGVIVVTANDSIVRQYTFFVSAADADESAAKVDDNSADKTETPKTTKKAKSEATTKADAPVIANELALKNTLDDEEQGEKDAGLAITFIASSACAIGVAGCIPVLKKRKTREKTEFIERLNSLK